MPRFLAAVLVAALIGVLPASRLQAQACTAFAPLGGGRIRVAANAAAFTYATQLGVSLTAGNEIFGTVGAAWAHDRDLHASTYDVGLEGGADVALDRARRAFLCPLAALGVSFGPHDFAVRPDSYRSVSGALGLGVAVVAIRSRPLTIVAAAGLRVVRLKVTRRFIGSEPLSTSRSDTYQLLSLGVGFVVNDRLTLRPGVTVPFGLAEWPDAAPFGREPREIAWALSVAIDVGRGSRAALRPPSVPRPEAR
jgi:hypothetical protein